MAHLVFGDFELDPASGELRKGKDCIRIQEQPLKLLLCLLDHPGQVVAREELQQRIWPGSRESGPTLVILPLRNSTGDPGMDYVAETLTRDVAEGLCRTPGLHLFRAPAVPPSSAALRLEGTLLRDGPCFHITLNLVPRIRSWLERCLSWSPVSSEAPRSGYRAGLPPGWGSGFHDSRSR